MPKRELIIKINKALLPKHFQVTINPNPRITTWWWIELKQTNKVPIYTRPEFIRMYAERLLSKEKKKPTLAMPKGTNQPTLF